MSFSTNELRTAFLKYFESQGHKILPSASLVPHDDPTLLFTNAGMVPFKNIFAGVTPPLVPRATTAQKVVRAGGKHNDLDNVGYTNRHHTFFEMMGNFSFGDYFKAEAIEFAWNFLTKEIKLDPKKLLVTTYADDKEAQELWKKIAGLSSDKIIPIPTTDNFWSMGDTGPCGPCSEIFYDHGPNIEGGVPGSPEEDGPRFTEIWNLVFMQFFDEPDGSRRKLGAPYIDTGLGLERFAALIQGKHDNYDTDQFQKLIGAASSLLSIDPNGAHKHSLRVLADHIRSTSFLIADGVMPEREGRGYVLRRIMRRAIRHIHQTGISEPVFYKLFPALLEEMGAAYPELKTQQASIVHTIKTEEERFSELLSRGMSLLDTELSKMPSGQKVLPGTIAFQLYDTFGFPLDLTEDVLREKGLTVDMDGFDKSMDEQKKRARASWTGNSRATTDELAKKIAHSHKATAFKGYNSHEGAGTLSGIFKGTDECAELSSGDEGVFILDSTPFYAESGGQAGDHGTLTTKDGGVIEVMDTTKTSEGVFLHHGKVTQGTVKVGAEVTAKVDSARRIKLSSHHSSTHLLNEALRRILGPQIQQKGSQNEEERLRFDVNHPRPITSEEIQKIEDLVNEQIRGNSTVTIDTMTPDEARKLGAQALFGEKYGQNARVVFMGNKEKDRKAWSIELCGGTHVKQLGDIGHFRITSESGVAGGVRRLEAVCGEAADQLVQTERHLLEESSKALKAAPSDLVVRIEQLIKERKDLMSELDRLRQEAALNAPQEILSEEVGSTKLIVQRVKGVPPKQLKNLPGELLQKHNASIVALASENEEKASIIVAVSPEHTKQYNAANIVRALSTALGGSGHGGGKPDLAQAGVPDSNPDKIMKALKEQL